MTMRTRIASLTFEMTHEKALLFSLLLGFVIRLLPEILAFPHPIGFDTVYYAARIKSGVVWPYWSSVFSTWLLYGILTPVYNVSNVDPFILLKLAGPFLYGLNVCGVYFLAKKALGWDFRKALTASFFFSFQLAALRISWDLLRNTLGLAVLLFTLSFLPDIETRKGSVLCVLLSILVVFSHEYASVIMFTVVLGLIVRDLLKGRRARVLRVLVAISPALAIFFTSFYLRLFPVSFPVDTNVIGVGDIVHPSPGGLFFMVNYLEVSDSIQNYPSYLNLASHVFTLFIVLYLLFLALIAFGYFRNEILDSWTLLLLAGSFGCLVVPFCALDLWNRWMFMLVYPFTFYAANGLEKALRWRDRGNHLDVKRFSWKRSKKTTLGIVLSVVLIGSFYAATPVWSGYIRISVPALRYFSWTPTVPLRDVDDTVEVIEWLNGRMNDDSCVLVQHVFLGWAKLYLDNEHTIVYFTADVEVALDTALEHGFDSVYSLWWNENVGLYGLNVPSYFSPVFESGRIAAFQYLG